MGQSQSHSAATPTNGLKYIPKRRSIPPPIQNGHRGKTRVPPQAVQRRNSYCTFDKKKCEDLSEAFTLDTSATTTYTTTLLDVSNCGFPTLDSSSKNTSLSSAQDHDRRPQGQQEEVHDSARRKPKTRRSKSRRQRSQTKAEPLLPEFVTITAADTTDDIPPPLTCFPTRPKCESCRQILAERSQDLDTVLAACMHFM